MDSKTIAIVAIFAALTVALTITSPVRIPAPPPVSFLKYTIWEIPIVVAFMLFGPLVGVAVAILNAIVLLAVYPGDLPVGPLYNLTAVLSMLLGIYVTYKLIAKGFKLQSKTLFAVISTALGGMFRVGIMTIVNWAFLRYPYPVGFSIPDVVLLPWLPLIGLFNFITVLYTVPLGCSLARAVRVGMKTPEWDQVIKKT
jgi:riboflavin transporter FmnP